MTPEQLTQLITSIATLIGALTAAWHAYGAKKSARAAETNTRQIRAAAPPYSPPRQP